MARRTLRIYRRELMVYCGLPVQQMWMLLLVVLDIHCIPFGSEMPTWRTLLMIWTWKNKIDHPPSGCGMLSISFMACCCQIFVNRLMVY
jgi:hypothetical protein